MKKLILFIILLLVACAPLDAPPPPDSDSKQSFDLGARIPVDDSVYTIRGEIVVGAESITEQRARGSFGQYGDIGSGSFSFWQEGKGFIRVRVLSSSPETDLAKKGTVVILKTTDKKMVVLQPGDIVTMKCRAQYEAIAAVRNQETFDQEKLETWELDYCRLVTPKIGE